MLLLDASFSSHGGASYSATVRVYDKENEPIEFAVCTTDLDISRCQNRLAASLEETVFHTGHFLSLGRCPCLANVVPAATLVICEATIGAAMSSFHVLHAMFYVDDKAKAVEGPLAATIPKAVTRWSNRNVCVITGTSCSFPH